MLWLDDIVWVQLSVAENKGQDASSDTFLLLIGVIAGETVIFLGVILLLRSRLAAARVQPGQVVKETIIVDGSDGDVLLGSP